MGVAQALISIFAEEDDKLRCIVRDGKKIAFLLKAPLYLFCVSDWGEPEHVVSRSRFEWKLGADGTASITFGVYSFADHIGRLLCAAAESLPTKVEL